MNLYHAWCNLKDGVKDTDSSDRARAYFGHLKDHGLMAGYRITRRQLALGPRDLPESHLMIEFEDLAQVDRVFGHAATRAEPVESFHHGLNSPVRDTIFALYRDSPDAARVRGREKF